MKRTMTTVFGVAAILSVLATTAIMAADISEDVNYKGTVNFDEGAILKIKNVQVTVTAAQLNAAGGGSTAALTPTTVTMTGKLTTTPVASVNVTNGQAVTLSGVINLLRGTGSAANGTNTITLAAPSASGQWAIIHNANIASNLIAVASSGTLHGPAIELSAGESAILFAPSATNWAGLSQ